MDSIQNVFVTGSQSSLYLGLQNGTFYPAVIYDRPAAGSVVVDFNRDYVADIVMASSDGLEFIECNYCEP